MRRIAAVALVSVAVLGTRWASTLPVTVRSSPDALLRVAWSARPERLETCREQSAEELARVSPHMRQPVVCEGTTASYRLEVRHDGRLLGEQVVVGGGLRRDRRLYVFREFTVPAGEALVEVRFERIEAPGAAGPRGSTPSAHVPPRLALEERLRLTSRRATLVTYASEQRALVALAESRD